MLRTMLAAIACLIVAFVAGGQTASSAPVVPSLPPPYDVVPQATVRIDGRGYGMYVQLTRYIPGILPWDMSYSSAVQVNVTLFSLDGEPVPGDLPQAAVTSLVRPVYIGTRGIRPGTWVRRLRGFLNWKVPLSLVPVDTLVPATSVTYGASSVQSIEWDSTSLLARIEFIRSGRVVASAIAPNIRVTVIPLPFVPPITPILLPSPGL